jgi:hypothetical protein
MIEKSTRTEYDKLLCQATIDDPGAYSKPWSGGREIGWNGNGAANRAVQTRTPRPPGCKSRAPWAIARKKSSTGPLPPVSPRRRCELVARSS